MRAQVNRDKFAAGQWDESGRLGTKVTFWVKARSCALEIRLLTVGDGVAVYTWSHLRGLFLQTLRMFVLKGPWRVSAHSAFQGATASPGACLNGSQKALQQCTVLSDPGRCCAVLYDLLTCHQVLGRLYDLALSAYEPSDWNKLQMSAWAFDLTAPSCLPSS